MKRVLVFQAFLLGLGDDFLFLLETLAQSNLQKASCVLNSSHVQVWGQPFSLFEHFVFREEIIFVKIEGVVYSSGL